MRRVFEPPRKSLLDVVRRNLHAAKMSSYVTRIVYIGKYIGAYENLATRMETVINNLKMDVSDVPITGMFLVYPQYYIHLLEAPEDIIYKHFKDFYDKQTDDCKVTRSIFLPFHHHVNQRFFSDWFHVYMTPPTLLENLESHDLPKVMTQVSNCLTKVYVLCHRISKTVCDQSIPMTEVVRNLSYKVARYFPESTVVEYLLNADSPVLMSIEKYLKLHSSVPFVNLYQDSIWPPPHDFMFSGASERHDRPNDEHASPDTSR